MKAAGIFISSLIIVDTFFVSYAVGLNSRHVLVVDPKLPPVKVEAPKKPETTTAQAAAAGKESTSTDKTKNQSHDPPKSQAKDHKSADAGSGKAGKPHKQSKKSHE